MAEGQQILRFLIPLLAFFVMPRMFSGFEIPDFDPLCVLIGGVVLMAAAQHFGFVASEAEGDRGGSGPGNNRRRDSPREDESSSGRPLEVQLSEAERCIQQNDYERAESLARKAADMDPESARAWELLATAQKWMGHREEALATVKKAKDIYEVESKGLAALMKELGQTKSPAEIACECETKGEEFISKRMYDLASGCYTQALEALEAAEVSGTDRPLHLRLLRRRAECAQQMHDWGTCRRDATALLEQDPLDPTALLQRAAANESLEKFKAALDDARKLLTLDPTSKAANRIVHNCQQALRH